MLAVLAIFLAAASARAADDFTPGENAGASIVIKPDAQVPLDLAFKDEQRAAGQIGRLLPRLTGRWCCQWSTSAAPACAALRSTGLRRPSARSACRPGEQFEIVTVSFNPNEGPDLAAAKKASYIKSLGKPEAAAGMALPHQQRPGRRKDAGRRDRLRLPQVPATGQYLHEAGIFVCTPEGRVSRVQQGVLFDPQELHDSLINASQGKISSGLFGVALSCGLFHFDAATGKYTWAALAIMRVTGIATCCCWRRRSAGWLYREQRPRPAPAAHSTCSINERRRPELAQRGCTAKRLI